MTRNGQKLPENLLDLLSQLTVQSNGENFGLSINDPKAKLALEKTALPPSPADLLSALTALGIQIPAAATTQIGASESLMQGIQSSDLPQPIKNVLGTMVKIAMATPLPASNLIDMGRTPMPAQTDPGAYTDQEKLFPQIILKSNVTEGFESDIKPIQNSGQNLDGDMLASLGLDLITSTNKVPIDGVTPSPTTLVDDAMPIAMNIVNDDDSGVVSDNSVPISRNQVEVPLPAVEAPGAIIVPRQRNLEIGQVNPDGDLVSDNGMSVEVTGPISGVKDLRTAPIASNLTAKKGVMPLKNNVIVNGDSSDLTAPPVDVPKPIANTLVMPAGSNVEKTNPTPKPVQGEDIAPISDNTGMVLQDKAVISSLFSSNILENDNDVDEIVTKDPEIAPATPRSENVVAPKVVPAVKPISQSNFAKIADQVTDRIETMVFAKKNGKVTLRLNPVDMGTITLNIKAFGNKVDAKVDASREEVRQALEANRQTLVQNVESRGLTLNSFHVGQDASQTAAQQQGQQASHAEAQRNTNLQQAVSTRTVNQGDTARPFGPTTSAVDYLI